SSWYDFLLGFANDGTGGHAGNPTGSTVVPFNSVNFALTAPAAIASNPTFSNAVNNYYDLTQFGQAPPGSGLTASAATSAAYQNWGIANEAAQTQVMLANAAANTGTAA